MPLFSSRKTVEPTPATAAPVQHNVRTSTDSHGHRRTSRTTGGGLFSSRRRSSSLSSSDIESPTHNTTSGNGLTNLFHRNKAPEDPTLAAARQRVMAAEQAEREADRALAAARISVRDAREHVKVLENEINEEARLIKIKQQGAKDLGKRAKPLGRHNRY